MSKIINEIKANEIKKHEHLEISDEGKRIFKSYATLNVKDKVGEIMDIGTLEPSIPVFMSRNPPILLEHTNKVIGRVLSAWTEKIDETKKAMVIVGEIFKNTHLENVVWDKIKNGIIKAVSISGQADNENGILKHLIPWEISLTENPALPQAEILAVNTIAKSEHKESQENQEFTEEDILKVENLVKAVNENNPWAICTAALGTQSGNKFERCVMHLKDKFGIKKSIKDKNTITNSNNINQKEVDMMNIKKNEDMGKEKEVEPKVENPKTPPAGVKEVAEEVKKEEVEEKPKEEETEKQDEVVSMVAERLASIEASLSKLVELLTPKPAERDTEELKEASKSAEIKKSVEAKVPIPESTDNNSMAVKKEIKKSINWSDMNSVKEYFNF